MSLRFSAMAMGDVSGYSQDAANASQIGELHPDAEMRSIRLSVSGNLKFDNPWSYVVTGEYKGYDRGSDTSSSDLYQLTDLALTIPLPYLGRLSIGKEKAPFSLERLTGRAVVQFMERPTILDALLPSRDTGLKLSNTAFDQDMTWSVGWFNTWFTGNDHSFGHSANTFAGRVTWVPVDENDHRTILHLGLSARYAEVQNDQLHYKGRPEDNEAPYFVDTGKFTASHVTDLGLEAAWQEGPFLACAEYLGDWVRSPQNNDPFFDGYYVSCAWMITGEQREYNRNTGFWGRISPDHPLFHGGWGALELATRYSWTDLDSDGIHGGKFDHLDRFGTTGVAQFFQARLQFEL
jgi:phosphate-selective porin OprO/OprP